MITTGFGDIHLRDAPPPLQLDGVALMLSGTAALAILFALITDALISARLARVLGANIPRGLRDHVVICGLGNIGYRMVEQLHQLGVPVVAAELQERNRYLPSVRRLGSRPSWPTSACPRRSRPCTSVEPGRWSWSPPATSSTWRRR